MKISGRGYLQKRGNGYRASVAIGKNPITGKYDYLKRTFPNCSKTEANRLLREWIQELESGIRYDASKTTLREYANDWHMQREAMGAVRKGTLLKDRSTIDRLCSYIGDLSLADIDVPTIKAMYQKMLDDGVPQGRIAAAHQKLKQILNTAIDDCLLIANPCNRVKVPQPKQQHERHTLTPEQAARLITICSENEGSRFIAIRIAIATGLRRGEVLGLTWDHIDLDKGAINVVQQITKTDKVSPLKTRSSIRTVSIDAGTIKALQQWKSIQRDYLASLWITQKGDTPVISNDSGGFYDPNNFSSWFRGFCIRNGLGRYVDDSGNTVTERRDSKGWPLDANGRKHSRSNPKPKSKGKKHYEGLRFHELRHTQATLLIANGTDIKTVQSRLGHSKASTTLDLYAHSLPENDRQAADLIGSLINPEAAPQKVVNL